MRKINNTFYVSVEGESELKYLDRVQELINNGDYPYRVKFVKKKENPTSFAKATFTGYSEFPYYHICDYEGNSSEDIIKFTHIMDNIKDARSITKVGYKLAYTNLCFELWLILHKKLFNRIITNKEDYKAEINNVYNLNCLSWEDIKKEQSLSKILKQISIDDIKVAISNAKRIENNNQQTQQLTEYKNSKYYKSNPSLNLHEFIEMVLNKCGC